MLRRLGLDTAIIALFVGIPLAIEWITTPAPTERSLHIEAFRYGTSPAIVRANRGDQLHFTFSTRDTGHSFFLQDYRIDAKIAPTMEVVEVVDPLSLSKPPRRTRELSLTAGHPGILGSLASVSRFRCHVYCGPMHGFEQGDLVVRPNVLLWGSLGLLAAVMAMGIVRVVEDPPRRMPEAPPPIDIGKRAPWVESWLRWRPLQFLSTLPVLTGLVLIVLAGIVGTKVGGRNIAVMMTWAVWMPLLSLVLAPFGMRLWCLVCPLPAVGEYLQRGAFAEVRPAATSGRYGNRFQSLGLRWPQALRGPWIRLGVLVGLGSLSASLAGQPRWTAYLLLSLATVAVLTALVWELRGFCRYLCPVAAFLSLYSAVGRVMVRARDRAVCRACREKSCLRGNAHGWACPFGLYLPCVTGAADCGICTECFKTCPHDNVSLSWRRGAWSAHFSSYGEAWQAIVMLVLAMVYSLTVHAPWPAVRDTVNVVDKASWEQFAVYSILVASVALGVVPLIYALAVHLGGRVAGGVQRRTGGGDQKSSPTGELFKRTMPALIPLGLALWVAFFLPVVSTHFTFILTTLSDPFGWGWNLFGTAGMPWVQIWPSAVPWFQVVAILLGVVGSLRRGYGLWMEEIMEEEAALFGFAPTASLLCLQAAGMLVYFTHF